MEKRKDKDEFNISIRMPRYVRDAIKRLAEVDDRSLNSEVIHALRQFIDSRNKQGKVSDIGDSQD